MTDPTNQPSRLPPPLPPIAVARLDYAQTQPKRGPHVAIQFIAGMAFPIVYLIVFGVLGGTMAAAGVPEPVFSLSGMAGIPIFIVLVVLLTIKLRWKGFLPGVLCTVFGLPLLAFVTCAIVLMGGGINFH